MAWLDDFKAVAREQERLSAVGGVFLPDELRALVIDGAQFTVRCLACSATWPLVSDRFTPPVGELSFLPGPISHVGCLAGRLQ